MFQVARKPQTSSYMENTHMTFCTLYCSCCEAEGGMLPLFRCVRCEFLLLFRQLHSLHGLVNICVSTPWTYAVYTNAFLSEGCLLKAKYMKGVPSP